MKHYLNPGEVSPDHLVKLIPIARGAELDFGNDERAMKRYRSGLYAINKNNGAGWRFRSMRDGPLLVVWRLT